MKNLYFIVFSIFVSMSINAQEDALSSTFFEHEGYKYKVFYQEDSTAVAIMSSDENAVMVVGIFPEVLCDGEFYKVSVESEIKYIPSTHALETVHLEMHVSDDCTCDTLWMFDLVPAAKAATGLNFKRFELFYIE